MDTNLTKSSMGATPSDSASHRLLRRYRIGRPRAIQVTIIASVLFVTTAFFPLPQVKAQIGITDLLNTDLAGTTRPAGLLTPGALELRDGLTAPTGVSISHL
ncbi:MAG: hypothetical protein OEU36_23920 [Gammaproteobacteria bacterium]|nr:hypothetical protein [Gammaproteobacteria bacterium]